MADMKMLKELALHAARRTAPANFSVENVDAAFAAELGKFCSDYNDFMENRYAIYRLMIEVIDEVVPKKTIEELGRFAEIRTVGQGERAVFKRRLGKNRAKKFVTQVGLSGLYETFRLDAEEFSVSAHAVGGAARIDFERMLDGAESMAEYMEIIQEGLVDSAYYEVQSALISAFNAGNGHKTFYETTGDSFDAKAMQDIITIVKSYGNGAIIFATPEFVSEMSKDIAIVPGTANYQGIYHPQDIDDIYKTGFITHFRGTPIVQLSQSYLDDTHDRTWLNPQYAFILPAGGEKVVKLVFEGKTQIRDWTNTDGSMEMHVYKKMGAAIVSTNNWGIYKNTNITDTSENPYGF